MSCRPVILSSSQNVSKLVRNPAASVAGYGRNRTDILPISLSFESPLLVKSIQDHKVSISSVRCFEVQEWVNCHSQLLSNYAHSYSEDDQMQKLSLSDWASVAEIAATVAVVISLIFVAISLERNTA